MKKWMKQKKINCWYWESYVKRKDIFEENKYVKINAIIGSVSFWVLMFIVLGYKQPKMKKSDYNKYCRSNNINNIANIVFVYKNKVSQMGFCVFNICRYFIAVYTTGVEYSDEAAHFARAENDI